jgi:hypothetical protein
VRSAPAVLVSPYRALSDIPHRGDSITMSTYGGELQVTTRMPPPDHSSSPPQTSMSQLRFRWPVLLSPMGAITTAVVLLALAGLFGQAHDLVSVAPREKDCVHEAKEYSQLPHLVSGNITAVVGHYNERRHQCLVEISSEKDENGGKSYYDEVLDPKTDHFIAARSRKVGGRGPHDDDTVITGAPVPLKDEVGAQSWFNGLMN